MLVNFLAALVAIQLIQGDMDNSTTMNFSQLWNSFLAVYQVFSSENWTTVLYNAAGTVALGQSIVVATFISCWLLFANCETFFRLSVNTCQSDRIFQSSFFRCSLL